MLLSIGSAGAACVDAVSAPDDAEADRRDEHGPERQRTPALVVVGIGIQWAAQTTSAAERAIQAASHVLFAVTDPWAARWITSLNEKSESLEYPRDGTPRVAIYEAMVERVLGSLQQGNDVCAVFYGSPAWLTQPAHLAVERARQHGFRARMLPGVSAVECLLVELGIDPGRSGLQVYEATNFLAGTGVCNPHAHLVLCQVGVIGQRASLQTTSRERVVKGLRLLQHRLSRYYPPEHGLVLYEAATSPLQTARIEDHPLQKLCDVNASPLSTLYVPPVAASAGQT